MDVSVLPDALIAAMQVLCIGALAAGAVLSMREKLRSESESTVFLVPGRATIHSTTFGEESASSLPTES